MRKRTLERPWHEYSPPNASLMMQPRREQGDIGSQRLHWEALDEGFSIAGPLAKGFGLVRVFGEQSVVPRAFPSTTGQRPFLR